MRTLPTLSFLTSTIALTMPLAATVLVQSPANESTVETPVRYTASASTSTCAKGVASVGVYIDNQLIYTVNGSKLNASLAVSPGEHQTVVEEWDRCGGANFTRLRIFVSDPPPPAPAPPLFSLPGGTYGPAQSLSISDATPSARIYFTTDGTLPTPASSLYSGPLPLSGTETIEAIAVLSGAANSSVTSATYTIQVAAAAPSFSLPAGRYTSVQSVAISDTTPSAIVFYTTNGSAPSPSSIQYAGPIQVSATETLRAMAVAPGHADSAIASATYSVNLTAATPLFSLPAGTYPSAQSVALFASTPGEAIFYTTNGMAPSPSSPLYTGPIAARISEAVMAVGTAPGNATSGIARADYVIDPAPSGPTIPPNTIQASQLQSTPGWKMNHDPGTPGSASGSMTLVTMPSVSGETAKFASSYSHWGGEIYHVSFALDPDATHFVYDA